MRAYVRRLHMLHSAGKFSADKHLRCAGTASGGCTVQALRLHKGGAGHLPPLPDMPAAAWRQACSASAKAAAAWSICSPLARRGAPAGCSTMC